MSKSDEMDNLIVDLINKFDATYQNIMDELPIKLKDPFLKVTFFVSNGRPRTSPSVFLSLYLVYKRQKRQSEAVMYIYIRTISKFWYRFFLFVPDFCLES